MFKGKPIALHPQLRICLPTLTKYPFKVADFKLKPVRRPLIYTGLAEATLADENLTDKSITTLIRTTATPLTLNSTLTVDQAVKLRSDPVVVKAVTTTDNVLNLEKTSAIKASPTLQKLTVAQ